MVESSLHNKYKANDTAHMTNTWKKNIIMKERLTKIKLSKQLSVFTPHFHIFKVVCTSISFKNHIHYQDVRQSDSLAAWTVLSLIMYIIVFLTWNESVGMHHDSL